MHVNDLLPEELEQLQSAGRIVNGTVVPAQPAQDTPEDRVAKAAPHVEPLSDDLKARLKELGGKVDATPTPKAPQAEDIAPEVRTKYLAYLLGAPTFTHSYPLFDGSVSVTFQCLSVAQVTECAERARAVQQDDTNIPIGSREFGGAVMQRLENYVVGRALVSLQRGDRAVAPDHKAKADVAWDAFVADLPGPLLAAIRRKYDEFSTLLSLLDKKVDDPDFWTPAKTL